VRDLANRRTTRASLDADGAEANGASLAPSLSADGRYVAFPSRATNLVDDDDNNFNDAFIRAVTTPTVTSVAPGSVARSTRADLVVRGSGFLGNAFVTIGNGVNVQSARVVSDGELRVTVSVTDDAPAGARAVTVVNPGTGPGPLAGAVGSCDDCLAVR
jgi:hypothetical protein